jgi:hypothetical protein
VYDIRMAAKKKDVKAKENQARKPVAAKATPSNSGMSLSEFKTKYKPTGPTSASVGQPGGKKTAAVGKGPAYTGPSVKRGADTGAFRGSSTPLGTSIAGTKTNKGAVAGAALLATSLPAKAGSVAAVGAAKITGRLLGRYAGRPASGAMQATRAATSKGLPNIRTGGRLYNANTVAGPALASTKIASGAQTAARVRNLEANATRITNAATRGAFDEAAKTVMKDIKTGKRIIKTTAVAGGLYSGKKKNKK